MEGNWEVRVVAGIMNNWVENPQGDAFWDRGQVGGIWEDQDPGV